MDPRGLGRPGGCFVLQIAADLSACKSSLSPSVSRPIVVGGEAFLLSCIGISPPELVWLVCLIGFRDRVGLAGVFDIRRPKIWVCGCETGEYKSRDRMKAEEKARQRVVVDLSLQNAIRVTVEDIAIKWR